jgi:hypothetical protein
MTTKWEIVSRVQNKIKDIPADIGSPEIVEFVEEAAYEVGNFTGSTPDLDDVGSKYILSLTNMAAAQTLGYMEGVGVSYNLGRMRIEKASELEGHSRQLEFLITQANNSLNNLGQDITFGVSDPKGN